MKRIYCSIDSDAWIQHSRFWILKGYFKEEFDLRNIRRTFSFRRRMGSCWVTPCYFFSWRALLKDNRWKGLPLERCMTSVTSHYNIGGGLNPAEAIGKDKDEGAAFDRAVGILKHFKIVTVNSRILYQLLSGHVPGIRYIPNGVDTHFFSPKRDRDYNPHRIRVGWVGKIKAAKNYELIKRLKEDLFKKNIEFREIVLHKDKRTVYSKEVVRDFYRSLDYYLCVSWHEGTPNPCLEAASCGVPLVTTRVGNMPDLVRDGENGFFISPSIESVREVIRKIKEFEAPRYRILSSTIRQDIARDWDWTQRILPYREAFAQLTQQDLD